jgi:hypothetical protein
MTKNVARSATNEFYDPAAALGQHHRAGRAAGVERATQNDLENGIAVPTRTKARKRAVVVDEDVDQAQFARDANKGGKVIRLVARAIAPLPASSMRGCFLNWVASAQHDNFCPFPTLLWSELLDLPSTAASYDGDHV